MTDERPGSEGEPDVELDPRPTSVIDRSRNPQLPEQRGSRLAWLVLAIALVVAVLVVAFGFRSGQ